MTDATMDQLRLNQLRKQYLVGEHQVNFYDIARDQLGLHSTDYWTPYLCVWSRIGNYDAKSVFESLNTGNHIVRANSFRSTVHVLHADNLALIIRATGPELHRKNRKAPPLRKLSDEELDATIDTVLGVLAEKPLMMKDLKKALPECKDVMRWLLLIAAGQGKLIRASASHARNNLTSYALTSDWVKGFKPSTLSEEEALREVIHRYIKRFGPVTIDDIRWWLAISKIKVKDSLNGLEEIVVPFERTDSVFYMDSDDLSVAASLEKTKEDLVWLLPYEDHFAKAFTERIWYLSEEFYSKLYPRFRTFNWPPENPAPPEGYTGGAVNASGEIRPSIWVNGRVVGRWEFDEKGDVMSIKTALYGKVTKSQTELISNKVESLLEFVKGRLLPISKK
ncbi:MAG: winged helix DNA-binding domain-containing protein [Candidatus Thorarchaeota archaeon]